MSYLRPKKNYSIPTEPGSMRNKTTKRQVYDVIPPPAPPLKDPAAKLATYKNLSKKKQQEQREGKWISHTDRIKYKMTKTRSKRLLNKPKLASTPPRLRTIEEEENEQSPASPIHIETKPHGIDSLSVLKTPSPLILSQPSAPKKRFTQKITSIVRNLFGRSPKKGGRTKKRQ